MDPNSRKLLRELLWPGIGAALCWLLLLLADRFDMSTLQTVGWAVVIVVVCSFGGSRSRRPRK